MRKWLGKRVVIIGAARQGLALARYLAELGAQVILNDQRPAEQLSAERASLALLEKQIKWVCGGHPLEILAAADLVCPSGGVPLSLPLVVEARRRGIPLSNDSQIFLEACPCRTIGITGSAGKTTTTSLVGRMAAMSFTSPFSRRGRVWVGGNIGTPLIAVLDQIGPDDLVVMELSSFQLEIMTPILDAAPIKDAARIKDGARIKDATCSLKVAAILNITPNHLDRHGSMAAYTAAKANILRLQEKEDVAVLGRDDPGAWNLAGQAVGNVVSFGLHRPPSGQVGTFLDDSDEPTLALWDGQAAKALLPQASIHLRGAHNLQNVLAACAISVAAGLPPQAMRTAVESFYGVPHRLELVRTWGGAAWYNDSIATAPERAMADILSFDEPIVLLAGGRDKDLPWGELAELVHQRVDHLIIFGEAGEIIQRAVGEVHLGRRPYTIQRFAGLQQAVKAAAELVEAGDVVLLSPGGTSFDEFRDFEARGEAFRQWVNEL